MRRDVTFLVDGVLRDFPRINMDRVERRRWLEVMAVSPGGGVGRIDGGRFTPVQERFARAMDEPFLRKLERIVNVIYDAYNQLTKQEQRVVALCCFDGLDNAAAGAEIDLNYRNIQRLKASAFEKMRRPCMDVISDVDTWRERDHAELSRQVSLLSVQ